MGHIFLETNWSAQLLQGQSLRIGKQIRGKSHKLTFSYIGRYNSNMISKMLPVVLVHLDVSACVWQIAWNEKDAIENNF